MPPAFLGIPVPRGIVSIALLFTAIGSQAEPTSESSPRFLRIRGRDAAKRKSLLTARKASSSNSYDPFYRSEGVRSGVEEESMGRLDDSGSSTDSMLSVNPWRPALNFRVLDNLEPVAPMDRLHSAIGPNAPLGGVGNLQPIYVPKFLNPDAFPSQTKSKVCNCTLPTSPTTAIECCCGHEPCPPPAPAPAAAAPGAAPGPAPFGSPNWAAPPRQDPDKKSHYTWMTDEPIPGTDKFQLKAADLTYRQGNYWGPATRNGLVAPADTIATEKYPLQAIGDYVYPIPTTAQEDRVGIKYSRYLDQVESRSHGCDNFSPECTVPCKPGDEVKAHLGNLLLDVKITKTFAGNAAAIEFFPNVGEESETIDCPLKVHCTPFRYCKSDDKPVCTESLGQKETHNWQGKLYMAHTCPMTTKACKRLEMLVTGAELKKGGFACKAKPPGDDE